MVVLLTLIVLLALAGSHYMAYTMGEEAGFKRFLKVEVEKQQKKDKEENEAEE